jgi:hypothetical protein
MLKRRLYKSNINVVDACKELDINPTEEELEELLVGLCTCNHCGTWYKEEELIPDLDDNIICSYCRIYYGE